MKYLSAILVALLAVGSVMLYKAYFLSTASDEEKNFLLADADKVTSIATEMHILGSKCLIYSPEQMKQERLVFLNAHRETTIADFLAAIDQPIEDKDIITFLQDLGSPLCKEYADSLEETKKKAQSAIRFGYGNKTIGYALDNGYVG
jgi:hypothetical protein